MPSGRTARAYPAPDDQAPLPAAAVVAVIGAGTMGSGIAQVAAQAGHPVRLFDVRDGAAADAVRKLRLRLDDLATKGRITRDVAAAAGARLSVAATLDDCADAALVVEAIAEDLAVKRALLRDLDARLAADAIVASNTSSLSITAIAAGSRHPARVAGMHFFNPAPLMALVEVVSGRETGDGVARTLAATAAAWGKTPVRAHSTPGFIVNRCARPFYGEALLLLTERAADAATLDAVMREAGGFRMGPFELMDLIGIDVNLSVTQSMFAATFGDPRYAPSFIQREMVDAGHLGRKSGRGFLDHAAGAAPPMVASEAACPPPSRIVVYGELGAAAALVERMQDGGAAIEFVDAAPPFATGVIGVGGAWLAPTDGRTATQRAAATGARDLVLFDWALDFATCKRLAIARADGCADVALAAAVGALQSCGMAVSRVDDVAGLVVARTVAMLVDEASDAVKEGVATADAVDMAMQTGVNYPRGPLAWGDVIGAARITELIAHLRAHYGTPRYRISPWLARRAAARTPLRDPAP
ncbi:MAG TPA: 3-hydroxyacyl-CoA dehydrogenase [Casimicrobiaceae bacterium]|nr:3-hydroxyacyl-CoA dehydrogenase [Casimicrobiaceae bacterium]